MEFGDLLRDLEKASAFELFRLNVAIDRALEDPQRLLAVKTALHLGMETTYFDTPAWREFPSDGFKTVEDARVWVLGFVRWYNTEHRHSAIKFVTPAQRHEGQDVEILASRERLNTRAKERNPHRWSGQIRNWEQPAVVWLNPERKTDKPDQKLKEVASLLSR